MIEIRPHVGDFKESMRRAVHIHTVDDLLAFLRCFYPQWRADKRYMVQVYCGFDKRNGWDTWLVKLRGQPAIWMDGRLPSLYTLELVKSGSAAGIVAPVDSP